jgi:hypothetical protein
VPEAGQRPYRTAVAALHAFGVDDTLHTLSLQQWVNAEGDGIETSLPSSVFRYTFLGASAEHHPQDRSVPDDSRKCALTSLRCV